MFQSLEYTNYLGYNKKTKLYSHEYELTDSDFRCSVVVAVVQNAVEDAFATGAVIREYSKRKLNVAANLVKFFLYWENECGYPIADQIEWADKYQPLFTPELKADLDKYLLLL